VVVDSKINGKGVFTTKDIKKGEVLLIWGGTKVAKKKVDFYKFNDQTLVPIDDDVYIGLLANDTYKCVDEYLNHSCDSNTWLDDEVSVSARRDIKTGEEITLDHALWDADPDWEYLECEEDQSCTCGSQLCRGVLTHNDWMLPNVQKRYKGHFSPYTQKKIEGLKNLRKSMKYNLTWTRRIDSN